MNIALYLTALGDMGAYDFAVETSFLMAGQHFEDRFIIITDQKPVGHFPIYSNIEIVLVKPIPKNALLKKLWREIQLPAILKKVKTDLFISFHNACSLTITIPQVIMIQNLERTRKAHIKKAHLLVVPNKTIKKELIEKFDIAEEKVIVIYPSANKMYGPVSEQEKEAIRTKYCEGKEFFVFNSIVPGQKEFIILLKSFSYFKKRQQSNFKLFLIGSSNSFFEKSLESYKYRNDVRFVDIKDKIEEALIVASGYAVVLPFNKNEDTIAALNAMQSFVPVIALRNSIINEAFGEAALYSETDGTKHIGESMMQVYTDENYRSRLIEKGKQVAGVYRRESAAELLWRSIVEALD